MASSSDDMDGFEGKTFGRYYLARLLARGGMGNVYLARLDGPMGFEKIVAVKVIHPHLARNRHVLSMFLDEARIAARINHGNVCSILDFGTYRDAPYIVMEYLHGAPLSAMIERCRKGEGIPPPIAAKIVADAARGLHAAHELLGTDGRPLGVVHRDVSPQNIFVLHEGLAKVLDFGIVRARGRLASTKVKEIKGKISYMAPEQLQGEAVDRRADVWALGVVLWEASLGQRLFAGKDFSSRMAKVLDGAITRPRDIDAKYPPALEAVVMSALQREPKDRLHTAAAMADALEGYLFSTGEPWGRSRLSAFVVESFSEQVRFMRELTTEIMTPPNLEAGFETTEPIDLSSPGREPPAAAHAETEAEHPSDRALVSATSIGAPIRRPMRGLRATLFAGSAVAVVTVAAIIFFATVEEEAPNPPLAVPLIERTAPGAERGSDVGHRGASLDRTPTKGRSETEAPALDRSPTDGAGEPPPPPGEQGKRADVIERQRHRRGPVTPPRSSDSEEPGTLNLLAIPNANVIWKGRIIGRTPLVEHSMPAGRHTLRLEPLGGGESKVITLQIRPGETTRRSVRFED